MGSVFAAADVGSNTAHLLVGEFQNGTIRRLVNQSVWISLGEQVSRHGVIPSRLQTMLIRTLKEFRSLAKTYRSEGFYVFATEALRKAANSREVLDLVLEETKVNIDIIPPQREAQLSLLGARLDRKVDGKSILIEVGGGSAQVGFCEDDRVIDDYSLPIGTGSLIAISNLTQPATEEQILVIRNEVARYSQQLPSADGLPIVASGGVIRGIWRMLHPDGDPVLQTPELRYVSWSTQQLDVQTIMRRFGVKERRASTLLPGSLCFTGILESLGADTLRVSEYGVREGAIFEMASGNCRLKLAWL
jgi:exopolyphosphatase/guanosine-5'-triphosphate,3'-diphosphate pyrophosphatase